MKPKPFDNIKGVELLEENKPYFYYVKSDNLFVTREGIMQDYSLRLFMINNGERTNVVSTCRDIYLKGMTVQDFIDIGIIELREGCNCET